MSQRGYLHQNTATICFGPKPQPFKYLHIVFSGQSFLATLVVGTWQFESPAGYSHGTTTAAKRWGTVTYLKTLLFLCLPFLLLPCGPTFTSYSNSMLPTPALSFTLSLSAICSGLLLKNIYVFVCGIPVCPVCLTPRQKITDTFQSSVNNANQFRDTHGQ